MAGRIGWLLAFFRRADPRGAAPSGWALAFDAAVAVGAAAGAVYEMTQRDLSQALILPLGGGAVRQAILLDGLPLKGQLVFGGPAHASAWLLVAAALTALPLAGRRLYPVTTWLAIIAAIVAVHGAYVPPVALGTAVYAAYSAFVYSRYRNLAFAVVAASTVFATAWMGDDVPRFPGRLTAIFAILAATMAGLGIRELRRRLADSTARLRRAADEARVATERALAAERSRIASELHDVLTHNVSVMIVQAGAARKIMASSPADAEGALLAVEATGREAMTELRNLLGLLSPATSGGDPAADGTDPPTGGACPASGGAGTAVARAAASVPSAGTRPAPPALRPQPGLGELDTLIGRVSAAGLQVDLEVTGSPRPLPPGANLAAYRVVQEGLTNVLRHAGQATAVVRVRWTEVLEITVSDNGPGIAAAQPDNGTACGGAVGGTVEAGTASVTGPGRGLLGLRERLALYGGELSAGARQDGSWCLRAVLPPPEPASPVMTAPGTPAAEATPPGPAALGLLTPGARAPGPAMWEVPAQGMTSGAAG